MDTPFFDLDINAKLPIIKAESDPLLHDLTNHRQGGDYPTNNFINNNCLNNSRLPKVSFRKAQNYEYCKRTHTVQSRRKDGYYHYVEPSAEDLLKRVEYDMDTNDVEWLKLFNEEFSQRFSYTLSEDDFEKIMDKLEKESYFDSEPRPEPNQDEVCSICNDGESADTNQIIFCDMCLLPVHQECYGVPYIPEGQWFCRRCLQSPSRNVDCVLCPNKGGAFKQTDTNKWAHVICALWIPEVCFANTVFLEPIDCIENIPANRWKLTCYICKQKKAGACIQCAKSTCYTGFHVTCAQKAHLYMKISTHTYGKGKEAFTDVKKVAFCDAHKPRVRKKKKMYDDEEADGDDVVDDDEDIDTPVYKKMKQERRKNLKLARKQLEEGRTVAPTPTAEPKVSEEKLEEISDLIAFKKKRKAPPHAKELRNEAIQRIHAYWLLKRKKRNGVPLLRRLQVSYYNSAKASVDDLGEQDRAKFEGVRYDLERARLLAGEVRKREMFKMKMHELSARIVAVRYKIFDEDNPIE